MKSPDIEDEIIKSTVALNGEETINYIKRVLYEELHDWNRDAKITSTRYFNHSFLPDFVLEWPNNKERYIYLRTTNSLKALRLDVQSLSDFSPIFITIRGSEVNEKLQEENNENAALNTSSKNSDSLVSSLNAVNTLQETSTSNSTGALLSKPLIKSGRSLITVNSIKEDLYSFEQGVKGAVKTNSESVKKALNIVDEILQPQSSNMISTFLQVLWTGNQGKIEEFPKEISMNDRLDDTLWNYLLSVSILTEDFWRSLRPSISYEQLTRLEAKKYPTNFNNLVKAKADSIRIKAIKAIRTQPDITNSGNYEDITDWHWTIDLEHLALVKNNLIALISDSIQSLKSVGDKESILNITNGLDTHDFEKRTSGRRVREITVENGENVVISQIPDDNAKSSNTLKLFDSQGRVTDAKVQLPSDGPTMDVHFTEAEAGAPTNSKPQLREFIETLLPVLVDLSSDEKESLNQFFNSTAPMTLF
ncbi:hypothetical protein OZX74_02850 [Bifidobacterium sp. ESL0798]|uniref:hypothetical protein n=1 Tax=Bifidobacterium sp. ESL0798 TaxID=2983235 RepID=UPI0023F8E2D5|nr:hypothetical protein [Bifidobacterium sp. ESL0798]WEV74491.1 hypothetical protein OZX74_02850 [Bifidobacterium sp. ESL0798]